MIRSGYDIANVLVGVTERPGAATHPMIAWAFELCGMPPNTADEVAWCGAFQMLTAYLAAEPYPSLPARARSWLTVGTSVKLADAKPGDTVILMRGTGTQPGPEVLKAAGHVGRFAGARADGKEIILLGGNQGNSVSFVRFPVARLLGIRRNP